MKQIRYRRVLLKLSGELFGDAAHGGIDVKRSALVARTVKSLLKNRVQVGVVVGAGNIFRARVDKDGAIDRVAADHMGMMATIINALALQAALDRLHVDSRVLSAIPMPEIVEDYVHKRAIKHLERGRVCIFAAGTGRPYFTTDTAAVVRALEIKADVVLKASDVDGVFDKDPHRFKSAKKFATLTFDEALKRKLAVMDATAFALAQENEMPIIVLRFSEKNVVNAALGKRVGTYVR